VAGVLVSLFLGVAILQLFHALWLGRGPSQSGAELRELLGFGTFLIALPILRHQQARKRFLVSLIALALALGLWGIFQWVGHFSFGGDVGVRQGVRLTSTGTGQLQGGLFGFPVAVVACYALLLGGAVRSTLARVALAAAIFLNAVSLLLTFERTFWIATIAGMLAVTLKANSLQRIKGFLLLPLLLVVFLATISVIAPAELTTARERLLSLRQYGGTVDRYRVEESQHVDAAIREHPIVGSGLAATIFWGRAWAGVPPKSYAYSHDGYRWLAWKIGIPGAALLVILLGAAVFVRGPQGEDALAKSIREGAQASLLTLLLASVTFPSFSALSITSVMGVLLALSVARLPAQREA
jgi:O-antigen ligase